MSLQEWIDKTISVVTSDGRNIVGTLKGYDQTTNLILEQSHERIFSEDRGVIQNVLGLYLIRGDNM
jgi:U6 snRNA-associated Sm-like protein LSm8